LAQLLVTGGAGYIGSHTLRALLRGGHRAVVVDDLRSGRAEFVKGAPLWRHDYGDPGALRRVFECYGPFDGVVHLAASISVAESVSHPLAYWRNNVEGSLHLIEAALDHGVRPRRARSSRSTPTAPRRPPSSSCSPTWSARTACAGRRCATSTPAARTPAAGSANATSRRRT
jgi:UDP-glucose 4-epimerase